MTGVILQSIMCRMTGVTLNPVPHNRYDIDNPPPAKEEKEGRCKATRKREFKLSWREAGSHNHHDDIVDSDQ